MPEYTLKNVKRPTNGSVITLKARAENGSSSDETNMMFQPWEITKKIAEFYDLKFIQKPDDFNEKIDVLLMIHPLDLSDEMIAAIENYSKNRGRILLFLDNSSILLL